MTQDILLFLLSGRVSNVTRNILEKLQNHKCCDYLQLRFGKVNVISFDFMKTEWGAPFYV